MHIFFSARFKCPLSCLCLQRTVHILLLGALFSPCIMSRTWVLRKFHWFKQKMYSVHSSSLIFYSMLQNSWRTQCSICHPSEHGEPYKIIFLPTSLWFWQCLNLHGENCPLYMLNNYDSPWVITDMWRNLKCLPLSDHNLEIVLFKMGYLWCYTRIYEKNNNLRVHRECSRKHVL